MRDNIKEQLKMELVELEAKINSLPKDAKNEFNKQAQDLRAQLNVLKEKWNAVASHKDGLVEDVRQSFKKDMERVKTSFNGLRKIIK